MSSDSVYKCLRCPNYFYGYGSECPAHVQGSEYNTILVPSSKTTINDEGTKFDQGKARVDLLPTESLLEIANVLGFGAKKYAAHNWRKGINYSRLVAAAMRHLLAWNEGEDKDAESGLSHLAHAGCCIMFLIWMEKNRQDLDDRFKLDKKEGDK